MKMTCFSSSSSSFSFVFATAHLYYPNIWYVYTDACSCCQIKAQEEKKNGKLNKILKIANWTNRYNVSYNTWNLFRDIDVIKLSTMSGGNDDDNDNISLQI
jgi:hypothetical protein